PTQAGRWPQRLRTGPELREPRCLRTPRRGLAALLGYPRTTFSCRLQVSAWLADARLAWSGQPLGCACGLLPQGLRRPLQPAGSKTDQCVARAGPTERLIYKDHRSLLSA